MNDHDASSPPSAGPTATPAAVRRSPLLRFGLPFVAIAVIAGAIFLLSKPTLQNDEAGSAELRAAQLGAISGAAPQRGEPAPDFALKTLEGETIRLSELRGKTVLINFWATWCGPCKAEMPDLLALYEAEKPDLVLLGINVEGADAVEQKRLASDFRDEYGLTFPILLDSSDATVFRQYQLKGMPDSFFVDRNGILREFQIGPMTKETMRRKLDLTRRAEAGQ